MNLKTLWKQLAKNIPLLLIIIVGVFIAVKNLSPGTYFSGWDNLHPEFNLIEYSRRVISGAWVEFQGTGAPASQAQLSEVPRLPLLYLLKILVPDSMNRYVFHLLMFIVGGIGMYFYLLKAWLHEKESSYVKWLACLGGLYYMLNIETLQQFYISFELFAVQFAFLPFAFLSVHYLANKTNIKNILIFIFIQLLIAPSGHTPTVFYFFWIFLIIYSFFVYLKNKKDIKRAFKNTIFITTLTVLVHAFWVIPNLYYLLHNAQYVKESRANQLFDLEALWSVREAGTMQNFLTGIHYIFNWKDFNFHNLLHEYIFPAWNEHLANTSVILTLIFFNLLSFAGFFQLFLVTKQKSGRWGLIIMHAVTTALIWMGLLLPKSLINFIYSFKVVENAIRNPFTKLSNIYAFTLTILLCIYIENIVIFLSQRKNKLIAKTGPIITLCVAIFATCYIALPSFSGNFINDKLKVTYPSEYFDMFTFLKTQPKDQRILELPFFSQSGWVYFDWNTQNKINGYQGIGFYFFGVPQALITPDFARWTEATDFFYHELRHALNAKDSVQLKQVLTKYNVNLILVDETALNQYEPGYDFDRLYQTLSTVGYKKIWQKNFLSIYENKSPFKEGKFILPKIINPISANTSRVREDVAYNTNGEYIESTPKQADVIYPFADLTSLHADDVIFHNDSVTLSRKIPNNTYTIKIPGIKNDHYTTPSAITYKNGQIDVKFPKTIISYDNGNKEIPQFENVTKVMDAPYPAVAIWVNTEEYIIHNNETIYPIVSMNIGEQLQLTYAGINNDTDIFKLIRFTPLTVQYPNWNEWSNDIFIKSINSKNIIVQTIFPIIAADFKKYPPENCSNPHLGSINTTYQNNKIIYQANDFAVNCSHYTFDSFKTNAPYLLEISGQNVEGRSIKFFANYNIRNTLPEEYLMPADTYRSVLSFVPITTDQQSTFSINWETRSYGQQSVNSLSSLKLASFPINQISGIEFIKNVPNEFDNQNNIEVKNSQSTLTFFYSTDVICKSPQCYLGIDQSYDDLWIAFGDNFTILPHYRYDNWANIWNVKETKHVTIIYFPQVIAFICMFGLLSFLIFLISPFSKSLDNKN